MKNALPSNRIWLYLTLIWVLIGLITHASAIFWMLQYEEEVTLYKLIDVGFYYYTPVFLWTIYTPILMRFYQRYPLVGSRFKQHLLLHLCISIIMAPIARATAIFLDYSIKNILDMASQPAWEVVYIARYIVIGSAPRAFFCYWVIIGAIITWEYFFLIKKNNTLSAKTVNKQQLIVPYKNVKKIIDVATILWIEANGNYVNIHTKDESFKIRQSLANLRSDLDEAQFFQVHRSKIINKAAIESMSHWRRGEYLIRLKNKKLLSSSRTYHQSIKTILAG